MRSFIQHKVVKFTESMEEGIVLFLGMLLITYFSITNQWNT